MKRFLSLILSTAMVFGTIANLTFTATTASAEDGATVVRLDPSDASPFNNGEFEGWGTALCWWANRLGYSEKMTQEAATAFFSEDGLGLDIARYNLGGGDDPTHNHITRSDSKVPGIWDTFTLSEDGKDVTNITYDITKDQNQLNIAKAALEANPNLYFEGFSNSAPYFMTVSGCTGGGNPASSDNLKTDMYDDFAKFIADGTKLFKDNGIVFQSYSPMNEPDTDYWGVNSPKQEGCHFTPGTSQSNMIVKTREALDTAGLTDVLVAGMDETSLKKTANNLGSLTAEAKTALGRVDTHTYSDRGYHAQVKAKAQELNKNLWMSEVDKGGNGFTLAEMILEDMNGMQPSAWVMWDIVDKHRDSDFTAPDGSKPEASATLNATDSLWGVGMGNHDTQTLELANKYYFYGQFTRYIKPGMTIIGSSSSTLAAYDKKNGDIVVVAPNSSGTDKQITIDMRDFSRTGAVAQPIRTDNTVGGEKWALLDPIAVTDKQFNATLKAGTITTFVVNGGGAEITKFDADENGAEYAYTIPAEYEDYDRYFAVYDNTNKLVAVSKNQSSGSFGGDFTGCTYRLLIWDGMEPKDEVHEVTVPQPVTYGSISGSTTVVAGVDYTYTASKAGVAADVTWSVSDNDVAEITNEGVLTAKTGGSVTLTATFADATSTAITIKVLAANQTIRIVNKNSGKGLETKSKGITSGTPLVQWENRDLDTAAWKLSPTADGKFNIINANANMLLVNDNGLKISNTVAETDDNAKWELKNHGGYYEIYNIGTQKSLNVSGQSTANGGNVILYTYAGGDNELWSFEAAAETLEHVVPVPVDYSAKYSGTNFTYVSNVASATNDFNDNDLKGFALTGDAALGSDSDGEAVLLPQSKLNNGANKNNSGTATLNLTTPITCEDNQLINLSFDMHTPISNGNSTFKLSSSDETELVDVSVTSWADVYSVTIGGDDVENSGNGAVYFRNNQSNKDNSTHVSRGGHVEVYYKPSTGAIRVTVKNVTNTAALQTYTGVVGAGKDIKKIYFEGIYTSYNKPLVVDNLVTNIVTYSGTEFDNVERPQETTAPTLPASGELINMNFNDSTLASTSTYGKATGSPKFVTVDDKQCIQFDGTNATVVTLTDANGNSLLTGQKNLTISFKVKPASTGTSWWLYAAPNDNAQSGGSETYLGVLEQNTKLTLERYKSGRSDCANKDGVLTLNEWHDVLISIADNVTSIYVDGVQAGSAASNVDISDMLGSKSVAYIGKANWGNGEYATGYLDDFVIYNYAFDTALASLDLGDTSAVTDDLTLPAKVGDTNITWATSDADVVTNAGVITRADETKTATLTASAVVNGVTLTKTFDITVPGYTAVLDTFAAYAENGSIKFTSDWTNEEEYGLAVAIASVDVTPEYVNQVSDTASGEFGLLANGTYRVSATMHERTVTRTVTVKDEEEMGAYLFAHFVGNESAANMEQIYFSVSTNGTTWTTLNGGAPVLTSNVGENGVRDPYILRGENGKFYIIATDLSIYGRRGDSNRWGTCQTSGSKNIVVWSSENLTNWSAANAVKVGVDNAGCVWAPEAVYDPEAGKYMVFWASKISTDNYAKQRMYRSYTEDFETFTEPEVYIENASSAIDTTIIQDKGIYYRFTKDETHSAVTMMKSASLSSGWKDVDTYTINGAAGNSVTGYEGPTIYKINGENKWCLLLDYYSKSQGYKPFVTTDLAAGAFTSAADFTFDATYRHGTVMPITTAEYNALLTAYPNN